MQHPDEFEPVAKQDGSMSALPADWRLYDEVPVYDTPPPRHIAPATATATKTAAPPTVRGNKRSHGHFAGSSGGSGSGSSAEKAKKTTAADSIRKVIKSEADSSGGGSAREPGGETGLLSKMEEEGEGEEQLCEMSARRRRKLSAIVPYPRRPRMADYSCSVCTEPYQVGIVRASSLTPWRLSVFACAFPVS